MNLDSNLSDGEIERAANEIFLALFRREGQARVRVRGESMFPTLRSGDVVVVEGQPASLLRPSDIVLFYRGGTFCTHRLREVRGTYLLTQGDANRQPDFPVRTEECLGRVTAIERNGKRIRAMNYRPALALVLRYSAVLRKSFSAGSSRLQKPVRGAQATTLWG